MGEKVNLQSTSAWESAEELIRLSSLLLPHVDKAIAAEESSLNYADYLNTVEHHGFISPEEEARFYEQTGQYFAENLNKLNKVRELLMWLCENVI